MAKQKCGTCRFFQEAGLAGSGWCHHPQRKVSSGVMIMVRRNELACRDEWSRSLWAAADPGQRGEEESFQRPPSLGPMAPAGIDDLQALVRAEESSSAGAEGEDVLLSEARIVSEHHEPPAPHFPQAGNFDPRTAVFRARERYRDRNRAKETAARQSGAASPIIVGVAGNGVPGEIPGEEMPAASVTVEPRVAQVQQFGRRKTGAAPPAITPEPGSLLEASTSEHSGDSLGHEETKARGSEMAIRPETEWSLEQFLTEASEQAPEPDAAASEPNLALDRLAELEERPLPDWFRTDLPRVCRTCRDYRPSADRSRGWCANSWAFTHRRMVQEDEVTPCDSSIGDWWVAVDDVWLVAADVSAHGRATPLLDRVAGKERAARKRS